VLARLEGQRIEIIGKIKRFGRTKICQGPPVRNTMLLLNVRDAATREPLTDHVWIIIDDWRSVDPSIVGRRLRFSAEAQQYCRQRDGVVSSYDWKLVPIGGSNLLPKRRKKKRLAIDECRAIAPASAD